MSTHDVENRAGERLRKRVLVLPARRKLGQFHVVAGESDLIVRREFGEAVEFVVGVEIAARLPEQMFHQGFEMQHGDQRRRVGRRFLKAEIFALLRRGRRNADRRIDDEMAELMRDDVEIEREGDQFAIAAVMGAHFHEAVAGIAHCRCPAR